MKYFFLLFLTLGCFNSDSNPELLLEDFINKRLSNSADKEYLLTVTAGKLKSALVEMDENAITESNELKSFEKESFKVTHKQCTKVQCFITYVLKYKNINKTDNHKTSSEVKKIAELQFIDEGWKIVEVTNVKTYFEMSDVINPLED
jgi:hypothetical protein